MCCIEGDWHGWEDAATAGQEELAVVAFAPCYCGKMVPTPTTYIGFAYCTEWYMYDSRAWELLVH